MVFVDVIALLDENKTTLRHPQKNLSLILIAFP